MASPFGIDLFCPKQDLEILSEFGHAKYQVRPKNPHPSFETYLVQATDNLGVVWIKGISGPFENDAYGSGVRAMKDKISSQLISKYGQGRTTDQLFAGAIWSEPRDWVMAIAQNERQCFTFWESGKASKLPEDISSIFLGIGGLSGDTANLVLEYASSRMEEAEAEIENSLSDLL